MFYFSLPTFKGHSLWLDTNPSVLVNLSQVFHKIQRLVSFPCEYQMHNLSSLHFWWQQLESWQFGLSGISIPCNENKISFIENRISCKNVNAGKSCFHYRELGLQSQSVIRQSSGSHKTVVLFVFNWGGMKPRRSPNKGVRPNPFSC